MRAEFGVNVNIINGSSCIVVPRVLQCIKKNGSSLEHLELSRSSLLRMDPLRYNRGRSMLES